MNRVAIAAMVCAIACSAAPAQAVVLNFTVNASGTRFDAVEVSGGTPNPPGTTGCLGVPSMDRICFIGLSPFRSFSFAQDFVFTAGVSVYDVGDVATTGRTRFTLVDFMNGTYGLTNFTYSFNNRTNGGFGPGRSEALIAPPQLINGSAVPEPATWAMMLAGFGALGFAMRRRSNVSTTVHFARWIPVGSHRSMGD